MVTRTHARTSNQTQTSALVHTTRTDTATGTAVTPPPPANHKKPRSAPIQTPHPPQIQIHSNFGPEDVTPRSHSTPTPTSNPSTRNSTQNSFNFLRGPLPQTHRPQKQPCDSAPLRTQNASFKLLTTAHRRPHSTLPSHRQPTLRPDPTLHPHAPHPPSHEPRPHPHPHLT